MYGTSWFIWLSWLARRTYHIYHLFQSCNSWLWHYLLTHCNAFLACNSSRVFWNSCYETHRVRVANELGSGNGKAAKFAQQVSMAQSASIGLCLCVLVIMFHHKFAHVFTSSPDVIEAVDQMSYLLAVTVLLNSVQSVLAG